MIRPSELAIKEARKELKEKIGDDYEVYYSLFDELLEKRLKELDPKFMKAMNRVYEKSGMATWGS